MIYTVTFNPSLDYVVSVENFKSGKMNRTSSESIYAGGKGINVSYVLSELGVKNVALGFVAGFTGEELVQRLKRDGVESDFVSVKDGFTRINVKMRSVGDEIEETEINGQGPMVSAEELEVLLNKIANLTSEDMLIISGSVSNGVSQGIYADIVRMCKEKDIPVVVDASSVLLWNVLEHTPFLIKPNKDELEDLFYRDLESKEEIIFYAKELQNRGARNVLVSLGKDGAVLVADDGEVYEMDAPQGDVLNSVGAGDSMVAGFIAGFLASKNYKEALKLGIYAGSATAFSEGLATKSDIDKLVVKK